MLENSGQMTARKQRKEECSHDIKRFTGRKDSNDSLGRRRRGAASAFSGYGTDSTGRGNSSKVRSHGRSGGTADPQL